MAGPTGDSLHPATSQAPHQIRVLVVDDNVLFREGLVALLKQYDDIMIAGQATNGHDAVRKATLVRPDVILMDISMANMGGVEAAQHIHQEVPHVPIAMLTVSDQDDDLFGAIRAGARGYLLKTVGIEELHEALHTLYEGGTTITPHLARRLLEEFNRLTAGRRAGGEEEVAKLTAREREVLELVAMGQSNQEIADKLVVAVNTVKVHLRNTLEKLELRNRQQLAAFAVSHGLITDIRGEGRDDE
ncbi:MAG TPA: response regulator transcription factor [Dehalococcoidia bacterium]|nr:response regulator transcription factor [Dehalococcoidia bacterium]